VGLVINLICAWLLKDDHAHHGHHHGHHHHHDHGHDHEHDDHHAHGNSRDNNLRAAYIHVLADALTSVLAIVALLVGRSYGWLWADPAMGAVGALVIARWSWGLIQNSGSVLLDAAAEGEEVRQEIREAMAPTGSQVTDLHVWQVGPGHFAAIVSLIAREPQEPGHYKALWRTSTSCRMSRSRCSGRPHEYRHVPENLGQADQARWRHGVVRGQASRHALVRQSLGVFVVAYALSPIDLIPDFIPVLGYVDDMLLLPALIWLAVKLLPPEVLAECRDQADAWMQANGTKPRSPFGMVLIVLIWLSVGAAAWWWLKPHL